jgi:hypothetical protein
MKEEYDTAMYYVNVIIKNGSDNYILEGDQDGEKGNTSQESVCNCSAEDLEGEEGSSNHIQTRKRKDNLRDSEKETYPPPIKKGAVKVQAKKAEGNCHANTKAKQSGRNKE